MGNSHCSALCSNDSCSIAFIPYSCIAALPIHVCLSVRVCNKVSHACIFLPTFLPVENGFAIVRIIPLTQNLQTRLPLQNSTKRLVTMIKRGKMIMVQFCQDILG